MRIITFTTDEASGSRYCIHLRRDEDGEWLLSKALKDLRRLARPTPILIEEAYREDKLDRTGLDLLIRLRIEVDMQASRSPVYVRLQSPVEEHIREHPKYMILCTPGVVLLQEEQDPNDVAAPPALLPNEDGDPLLDVLEALPIRPEGDGSRHDLANRWGPLRLWHGLQLLRPKNEVRPNPKWYLSLAQELRGDLPYAYLLALGELRMTPAPAQSSAATDAYRRWQAFLSEQNGAGLRVLLLDDEIHRGWGDAVEAALGSSGTIDVDTSLAGVDFDADHSRVEEKVSEGWDLVLADLRTSAADLEKVRSRRARQYDGAGWIAKIKAEHPETAVVAFTASNKAWSVQELQELGIDGYWTKESPEFGVNDDYSVVNAARLLDSVRDALERRANARPGWSLVEDLERLADSSPYLHGWAAASEQSTEQVEARLKDIIARGRRAYGFLVMHRSEHEEQEFRMRRENLAFISLWSIINEVSKLYFTRPRHDPRRRLWELPEAEFTVRNPLTGQLEVYWHTQGTREIVPPDVVPEDYVDALCPLDSADRPVWPSVSAETIQIEWLLHWLGADDLRDRFAGNGNYKRRGLRYLRNNHLDVHGTLVEREGKMVHKTAIEIADVHALCDIWRALLVTPYDPS